MVMLSTKYLVNDYKAVPETWVFQHYCKLSEKLTGQDVKLKSVFNPKEKTPSMCVYLHRGTGKYKFKDFSTGKQGSCVDLVKEIFKLDFKDAARKIVADYNEYTLHNNGSYNVEEFKQHSKYKVVSSEIRNWNTKDQYFWTQFNIVGSYHFIQHFKSIKEKTYFIITLKSTFSVNFINTFSHKFYCTT